MKLLQDHARQEKRPCTEECLEFWLGQTDRDEAAGLFAPYLVDDWRGVQSQFDTGVSQKLP